MSRLTKKSDKLGYCLRHSSIRANKCWDKLGRLEDILEGHNIETLEELDGLLWYLKQIKDIEKHLGVELITLFKALKNGFYYKEIFRNIKTNKVEEIIHYNNYAYFYYVNDYDTYTISTINHNFYSNRYGKDWALTEEELECHK